MNTNIITNNPKIGDAVVGNLLTGKVEYIKGESFSLAALNSSVYETIGAVYGRRGRQVKAAFKENANKIWCTKYSYRLSGYTLDGTNRSGVISIRESSSASANTDFTVSYNATTVQGLVDQLNAFFQATAIFKTQKWAASVVDGAIDITFDYTFWQQSSYNTAKDGFAFSTNLMPDVTALANIRRKNGYTGGEGVISSFPRALAYFRDDNSSTTYNPSTDVTNIKRNYPICLPGYLGASQYQSDHCAKLREVFGEGEEGWLKFMASCMPVKPCDNGNMGTRDGLERTKVLASKLTADGAKMCPAADYCYSKGTVTVPQGNWYLPTVEDISDLLDTIQYGTNGSRTADPVNATLYKMGGSAISNGSNIWACCRGVADGAWSAYGYFGFFVSNYMCSSGLAVPVALLII